jgi:hypothetical protein
MRSHNMAQNTTQQGFFAAATAAARAPAQSG